MTSACGVVKKARATPLLYSHTHHCTAAQTESHSKTAVAKWHCVHIISCPNDISCRNSSPSIMRGNLTYTKHWKWMTQRERQIMSTDIMYVYGASVSASTISINKGPYVAAQCGKYSGVCIFFWQEIKYVSRVYKKLMQRLTWYLKFTFLQYFFRVESFLCQLHFVLNSLLVSLSHTCRVCHRNDCAPLGDQERHASYITVRDKILLLKM